MNGYINGIKQYLLSVWKTQGDPLLERLSPVVEQLRPIWTDPLWQFVGLLVSVILLLVLTVVVVKYFSGVVKLLLDGVASVGGFGWQLVKSSVAALAGLFRKADEENRKRMSWMANVRLRSGLDAVRYLTTKRDWRYQTSWYLLGGCDGSARHQWVAGLQEGRRTQLLARERNLIAAGSQWHFFDQGIIIAADSSGDYNETVNLLSFYRPERPVDGLILEVSATLLLDATTLTAQKQLGEQLYRQMWELQKVTGFVVPVYLVVTGCEQVNGFQAFWASQPEYRLREMFGWSNPTRLDTAFNAGWVTDTFQQVADSIHNAQLQVAASGHDIVDIDSFMLFGREFQTLQTPLQQVVNVAFARSSFQEALPLRGIWFTGMVNGEPALSQDFLVHKLWPETNLAYPMEKRSFSANATLRRFQYGTLGIAAMLLVLLMRDTVALHSYAKSLEADWVEVAATDFECSPDTADDPGDKMWLLLGKLTRMGQQPLTLSIPASWSGGRMEKLTRDTATRIYPKIFRDMECRLEKKGRNLRISSTKATNAAHTSLDKVSLQDQRVTDDGNFMENLLHHRDAQVEFKHLAGPLPTNERVADDFRSLLDYLYDSSIPPTILFRSPLIEQALMQADYDYEFERLLDQNALIAQLNSDSTLASEAIIDAALNPPLAELQRAFAPDDKGNRNPREIGEHGEAMVNAVSHFDIWIRHMTTEWLATDAQSSPCGRLHGQGMELVNKLKDDGFSKYELDKAVSALAPEKCDQYVRDRLKLLNGGLFGNLIVANDDGRLSWSTGLLQWQQQMQALQALNIISRSFLFTQHEIDQTDQVATLDAIDRSLAEGKVVLWQVTPLNDAIDLVLSYQSFKQRWWMTDKGVVEPFYATALQQRMKLLVNALVQRALLRETATSPSAPEHDRDMEAQLAQRVDSFQKASTAVRQLGALLAQEGFASDSVSLNRSARNFVGTQLDALWDLVEADRLYGARVAPDWKQENFAFALFGYSEAADIASYLDHQRLRAAYLAQHYARPLVGYLVDNGGVAQTDANAQRWIDTLRDLRRYERKEPGNNVELIEQYVTGKLQKTTAADCNALLQGAGGTGSTLAIFVTSQTRLDQQVRSHCKLIGKHGVIQEYMAMAQRFNGELANHFPFAALDNTALPELRGDVANRFFRDYQNTWAAATGRAGLYKNLQELAKAQPKLVPASWLNFVANMDRLSRFWNQVMVGDDAVQLSLSVEFAALPEKSQGIQQIIEWELASGVDQLSFPNGGTTISWKPGDRLMVGLRWASGSGFRPAHSLQLPVQIDEAHRRALFLSQRQWSLFEWIQRFADADNSPAQGTLLSFQVPVVTAKAADDGAAGAAPVQPLAYVARANLLLAYVVAADDGSKKKFRLPTDLPRLAPEMPD